MNRKQDTQTVPIPGKGTKTARTYSGKEMFWRDEERKRQEHDYEAESLLVWEDEQ